MKMLKKRKIPEIQSTISSKDYLYGVNQLQITQISNSDETFLGSIEVKSFQCFMGQHFPVTICDPQTGHSIGIPDN